jgi:hypothetical protein
MEDIIQIDGESFVAVGMKKDVKKIGDTLYFETKEDGKSILTSIGKDAGIIEIDGKIYRAVEPTPGKKALKVAAKAAEKVGKWVLYGGKKTDNGNVPRKKTGRKKKPRKPTSAPQERMGDTDNPFQNSGRYREPGAFREPKILPFRGRNVRWDPGW